ncbi:hypothetical protein A3K64_02465 [Candidatus Micrarchaeota archaeon RBG_16_36_9]|nr:MAG: hypothetical protein A3K64_02465 [Candidatus Micrarchaeota archaeon RBG_16_36_9]
MLEGFINDNFIAPLCHYYTPIGTITYGLILILAVIGTFKLLKKLKVKIDKKLLIGILPFIVYGGWTRALRDYGLGVYGQSKLFCSPPIYFFVFAITLISLLAGIIIERKMKKFSYEKVMLLIGILFLLYNASITHIVNIFAFSLVLLLAGSWFLLFFGIHKIKPKLLSLENAGILSAHLLDASSTFTALTFFGFYEQHVLPNFLIDIFGPWIMFPLKIVVVWTVLWIIDRSKEDLFFKRFLKIIILILGLPLGIRDFLTISLL